jgi:hypothetical protein
MRLFFCAVSDSAVRRRVGTVGALLPFRHLLDLGRLRLRFLVLSTRAADLILVM